MKVGVISDIHSNIVALNECIKRLENEGCDEYLLLGDYIADTPYTRETVDCLYEFTASHKCTLLRGNREEYVIAQRRIIRNGEERGRWIKNSASGNLLFTYEKLNDSDIDFFESLPISFVYDPEGYPAITCCHGSPENNRELLQHDGENTKQWMKKISTDYLLCAHTHIPGMTVYGGKHYFNTGCVGIAIGTPGLAQCMTLESDGIEWIPQFLLVPYDNRKVAKDCFSLGLMDYAPWFINSNLQILLSGCDNSANMVELAKEIKLSEQGECEWPYIEECYFEKAAQKLGIPDYRNSDLKVEL